MTIPSRRTLLIGAAALAAAAPAHAWERRDAVSFLRGPYNEAFFHNHNRSFRIQAGMHFFHSKQHDLLQLTPLADHAAVDKRFEAEALDMLRRSLRTEPEMEYYSEYVDRAMHLVFQTIDWTHVHHGQTYDILSSPTISWADKKRWTDRAVRYYLLLEEPGVPRSPAPLDVTMRRAGVMMKPYFTYFRNYYPRDQGLFFVAHWWHPAAYDSLMMAGPDVAVQEQVLRSTDGLMWDRVIPDYPQRMMLSREISPRYSRFSPESANIFDNLHMLHGITYDILAYEKWTPEEKRAELYRVIHAMGYHPGDETLARKFVLPHPDYDPRTYPDWVRSPDGAMGLIMMEMLAEMAPVMTMPSPLPPEVMAVAKAKLRVGVQPGEGEGSLQDALMAAGAMHMDPLMMAHMSAPGVAPQMMIDAMLAGWRAKHGAMPDVEPYDMSTPPPPPAAVAA